MRSLVVESILMNLILIRLLQPSQVHYWDVKCDCKEHLGHSGWKSTRNNQNLVEVLRRRTELIVDFELCRNLFQLLSVQRCANDLQLFIGFSIVRS